MTKKLKVRKCPKCGRYAVFYTEIYETVYMVQSNGTANCIDKLEAAQRKLKRVVANCGNYKGCGNKWTLRGVKSIADLEVEQWQTRVWKL